MSQAFMQVGMQIVTDIAILLYQRERSLVDDKLFFEATTMSCLIVSIGNIRNSDALRTMLSTNPVSIGQVDADSCRRIFVATQHGCTNGIGGDTLYMGFTETRVDGRMVFEPLSILADGLRTLGSLQILILHNTLPRTFQS